jgi:isoleucyl-tRNA synthetase
VKEVWFGEEETKLATLSAKPNFKLLGPRLGPKVKAAAGVIAQLSSEQLDDLLKGGTLSLDIDGTPLELTGEDLAVERTPREGLAVASEGSLIVALETELNADLISEGLARELVNKLQNLRKEREFDVSDRIVIHLEGDAELLAAVQKHEEYVKNEVLCVELIYSEGLTNGVSVDVNNCKCTVCIEKSGG